jgi:tetratricopeptide (TPR) repeat protein
MAGPVDPNSGVMAKMPAPSMQPRQHDDHSAARLAVMQRRFDDAKAFLAPSLLHNPDDVDALCLSALVHWRSHGDFAAAESHLARARALRPHDPSVLTLCAEFALHLGDVDAVFALAGRALAADGSKSAALIAMARADARRVDDAMLDRMHRLTQAATTKSGDLRHLHNAIGRVLDARADYDAAFDHFSQSNQLASGVYDASVADKRLAEVRRVFTRPFFDARHDYGLRGYGAIFIVGPPRTGSTLIEQMLKAHPGIESSGESDAVRDIEYGLRRLHKGSANDANSFGHIETIGPELIEQAASAYLSKTAKQMGPLRPDVMLRRRVDKKLSNFLHTGLIHLMFPDAVFLQVRRHPLDVCLSC